MYLPYPLYSSFTIILYVLLLYILIVGFLQYIQLKKAGEITHSLLKKSLVPLGALATVVGFMGLYDSKTLAFDAIAAAGDISPALVANGLAEGYPIITLGLLCLAISFLFKYFNS